MPRMSLTAKTALGGKNSFAYSADAADLAMVAADPTNYNQAVAALSQLVICHNTGGADATINVTCAYDPYGRRANALYTLGAGEYCVLGPFVPVGWHQIDNMLYIESSTADVKLAVVNLP